MRKVDSTPLQAAKEVETVYLAQITSLLHTHIAVPPLCLLITSCMMIPQSWTRHKHALSLATMDESNTTATISAGTSHRHVQWTRLAPDRPLWDGDGVAFLFAHTTCVSAMSLGVSDDYEADDCDELYFNGISCPHAIYQDGTLSPVRPHVLDDCRNVIKTRLSSFQVCIAELTRVEFRRDRDGVWITITIGTETQKRLLSVTNSATDVRLPYVAFYMYSKYCNPLGWSINIINSVPQTTQH